MPLSLIYNRSLCHLILAIQSMAKSQKKQKVQAKVSQESERRQEFKDEHVVLAETCLDLC